MSQRILITGADGFIGKHLTRTLSSGNYYVDVTLMDKKLGSDILTKPIAPFDVVIHLAADPLVQESIKDPYHSYRTNVMGTLKVLEACRAYGAKLVFASSAQASARAVNPYALQKYHCENLIKQYGSLYGIKFAIQRIYNVFGPNEHGVTAQFLAAQQKGLPLEVYGGQQRRDFIHVDTVVAQLIASVNKDGIFKLGSGHSTAVQTIADLISSNQNHHPLPAGEPLDMVAPYGVKTLSIEEYLA